MRHITYKKLGNQMTDSRLWLDILSYCFSLSLSLSLSLSPNDVMMRAGEPSARPRAYSQDSRCTHLLQQRLWLAAGDITGEQNKPWKAWLHCLHGWEQQAVNKQLSLLSPPDLLPFTMKDTRDQASQTTWAREKRMCNLIIKCAQIYWWKASIY